MMTQRCNTSTRVRKQAGPSIFSCSAQDLDKSETRYEMFRERIGWVRRDSGDVYETWAVEVLHKDYQGSFDIDTVFLNPILMRVNSLQVF